MIKSAASASAPIAQPLLPTRRRALALVPAIAAFFATRSGFAAEPTGIPADGAIDFLVFRNDSEIGTHRVRFTHDGDRMTVQTEADFKVSFGFIVVFRYTYRATETWRNGVLESLSAHTDNNGTKGTCEAHRDGTSMVVDGSVSGHYIAPPGAIASTHWNKAELAAPMINPENGELMKFDVRDVGRETLAGGVAAQHFGLTGYATMDLWYDDAGLWRHLKAVAKDGSTIDYRPGKKAG